MSRRTKAKVTRKHKVIFQITEEEIFEISEEVSRPLPPGPRQRQNVRGGNPGRRALPKGKPAQQQKQLPPEKKPLRKLVGSITKDMLKELAEQNDAPELQAVPDVYFDLLRRKKHNANRKALTGSRAKALPEPKKRRV